MFTPESVRGFVRHLRVALLGREAAVTGSCLRCGRCCRNLVLQAGDGPLDQEGRFEALCRERPEYRRFVVTGRSATGLLLFTCAWLEGEACSDHGNRLDLCRRYPNPNTYFLGFDPLPGCGFRFEERPRAGRSWLSRLLSRPGPR